MGDQHIAIRSTQIGIHPHLLSCINSWTCRSIFKSVTLLCGWRRASSRAESSCVESGAARELGTPPRPVERRARTGAGAGAGAGVAEEKRPIPPSSPLKAPKLMIRGCGSPLIAPGVRSPWQGDASDRRRCGQYMCGCRHRPPPAVRRSAICPAGGADSAIRSPLCFPVLRPPPRSSAAHAKPPGRDSAAGTAAACMNALCSDIDTTVVVRCTTAVHVFEY